jgi:hypothetical protein
MTTSEISLAARADRVSELEGGRLRPRGHRDATTPDLM